MARLTALNNESGLGNQAALFIVCGRLLSQPTAITAGSQAFPGPNDQ